MPPTTPATIGTTGTLLLEGASVEVGDDKLSGSVGENCNTPLRPKSQKSQKGTYESICGISYRRYHCDSHRKCIRGISCRRDYCDSPSRRCRRCVSSDSRTCCRVVCGDTGYIVLNSDRIRNADCFNVSYKALFDQTPQ